jgi:hypothetical protein
LKKKLITGFSLLALSISSTAYSSSDFEQYLNINQPMYHINDASLSCDHDRDYDCSKWARSAAINEIQEYLRQTPVRFTVTEQYISTLNKSISIAVVLGSVIPINRLSYLIKKITNQLYLTLIAEGAATVVATMASFQLEPELKVGDVLLFVDGGKKIILIPAEGEQSRYGFDDSEPEAPTELDQGANEVFGGFRGGKTISVGYHGGGKGGVGGGARCSIGYTGSKGRMVKQWICGL